VLQSLADDITSDTAACIQTGRPYTTINSNLWTACATSCLSNPTCRNPIGVASGYFTVKAHGIMHETEKIVTAMIKRDGTKVTLISWESE